MTIQREIQLRKMAASGGLWGMMVSEIKALEAKYGVKCEKYSCGSCAMKFLQIINSKYPMPDEDK